jgi:pilus assembly protein FimV
VAGAETEIVEQPTAGVDDVMELDTLMDDEARMTFEVEHAPGEEPAFSEGSDTELIEVPSSPDDTPGEELATSEGSETELIGVPSSPDETEDTLVADSGFTNMLSDTDEAETKLELARAYIEMGDKEGARATLEELLESPSDEHRRQAEELLRGLG